WHLEVGPCQPEPHRHLLPAPRRAGEAGRGRSGLGCPAGLPTASSACWRPTPPTAGPRARWPDPRRPTGPSPPPSGRPRARRSAAGCAGSAPSRSPGTPARRPAPRSCATARAAASARTAPAKCSRTPGACGGSPTTGPSAKAAWPTCCCSSARWTSGGPGGAPGSATGAGRTRTCGPRPPEPAPRLRASGTTSREEGNEMSGSGLRARLGSGSFTVTAEIGPPRGADPGALLRKAEQLRGWVDAVNITDNAGANVRMGSWAGSLLAAQAGMEPVMQVTCRDRNRLALQSDLLAAWAMGIPNVLLMTGDHPRFGDHPGAEPVFDLDSVQLLWAARTMRE